jgi:hypothetical protein
LVGSIAKAFAKVSMRAHESAMEKSMLPQARTCRSLAYPRQALRSAVNAVSHENCPRPKLLLIVKNRLWCCARLSLDIEISLRFP